MDPCTGRFTAEGSVNGGAIVYAAFVASPWLLQEGSVSDVSGRKSNRPVLTDS